MTRIDAPFLMEPGPQAVCGMLTDAGYQAWYVGGCVRNALLGLPTTDLDLTTNARPETVMKLAGAAGLRALPTGIDHGTVTVLVDGQPFEITTFRKDVETDGRHAVVRFSDDIAEDAARRDFTMNALYADPEGLLSDPLGGLPDLQERRVRFIGEAEDRILEDALRILRFFRFHAVYGDPAGGIDPDGLAACAAHIDMIGNLSKERVGAELIKLLSAADPGPALAAMAASGALAAILPGALSLAVPILVHVEEGAMLAPDPIRRLAALGGEGADSLRLSKAQMSQLARLRRGVEDGMGAAELGYRYGATEAVDILALRAALLGGDLSPVATKDALFGAGQKCPIRAADLMPEVQGEALGKRLKEIEARWIASGFALSKADLLR